METDCPYMAPVPYRGKRNRSEYISNIIETISSIRGISRRRSAKLILYENVRELLKLK